MVRALTHRTADGLRKVIPFERRRQIAHTRLRLRTVTGMLRALPDFLVVGTQRGGTSSLYKYLGRHPQIVSSLRKETEYFTMAFDRGEQWYRAHYPLKARSVVAARLGRPFLTFEATPDYLVHPLAAERSAALLPGIPIVAMLRNPVDRAYSHYKHMVRLGFEKRSFEQAVGTEAEDVAPMLERMATDPRFDAAHFLRYSYLTRGRYAEQVSRWLAHYPDMLVIKSEDFYAETPRIFGEILAHLGLDSWQPGEFANYSYSSAPPRDSALPDHLHAELSEQMRPHNEALYALLDRDFGWDA